ncbi:unnamed protein product [Camellia sinensis]
MEGEKSRTRETSTTTVVGEEREDERLSSVIAVPPELCSRRFGNRSLDCSRGSERSKSPNRKIEETAPLSSINRPSLQKIEMKKSENAIVSSSKIKFDESDEHESSSEDEREIERELADVTFEDLQKARSNGSHAVYKKPNSEKKGGRANKNRCQWRSVPRSQLADLERSFKFLRRWYVIPALNHYVAILMKMDERVHTGFKKRYNFLYENELPAEREELKKSMKKSSDPAVIDELKNRISWIDKQIKSTATKRTDKDILSEHKKKEREATKQGKRPFYLKQFRKFVSKGLLKNTRSSRHLASSNPMSRKGGGRMLQRIIDLCHIGGLALVSSKISDTASLLVA